MRRRLALLLTIALVLTTSGAHPALLASAAVRAAALPTARIEGPTPYATAAAAMLDIFPTGAGTVVIASGDASAAAASQLGASLAGAFGGPLLFTPGESLDPHTADAIRTLGATEALIVGGPGVVSPGVEASLTAMGLTVERHGGSDLYGDAHAVALATRARAGTMYLGIALLAVTEPRLDWRATYALAPNAYRARPILFTGRSSVPSETMRTIAEAGVRVALILGSEAYVDPSVDAQLRDAGLKVRRITETSRAGLGEALGEFALAGG